MWDLCAVATKLTAYLGCFLAVGTTLYMLATVGLDETLKQRLRCIIMVMAIVGIVGSMAQFTVQSGRLLDEGLAGMFDSEMLALVKDAPLGTSVTIRLTGLIALVAFAFQIPLAAIWGLSGAIITASSFSFVGHGTNEPRMIMAILVTLHVLGISFWIGALWPLRQAASRDSELAVAGKLAHKFGKQAAWVVGGLIVAGLVLAYLLIGSIVAVFSTQYGLTLLAKLAIVAALLGLALANKLRFVPALQAGDPTAAQHLRRSIAWEMLAVAIILVITAMLTTVTLLPETMEMTNG